MNVIRVNGINNINSNQQQGNQPNFGFLSVKHTPRCERLLTRNALGSGTETAERLRKLILKSLDDPTEIITDAYSEIDVIGEKTFSQIFDYTGENFIAKLCEEMEKIVGSVENYVAKTTDSLEGVISKHVFPTKNERFKNRI
jgi:hypothetical protein